MWEIGRNLIRGKKRYEEVIDMKKFFSLLCVVLLLVVMIPTQGLAAESEVHANGTNGHQHNVLSSSIITERDGWAYYDATYHVYRYRNEGICEICGQNVTWYTPGPYSTRATHHKVIFSASCDGTWQTHVYECTDCGHRFVVRVKCSAGPHTGSCPNLPV